MSKPEFVHGSPIVRKAIVDKMYDNYIKPYGLTHGVHIDKAGFFGNMFPGQVSVKPPSSRVDYGNEQGGALARAFFGKALQTTFTMNETMNPIEWTRKHLDDHFNHGYANAYINKYRGNLDKNVGELYEGDHGWDLKIAGVLGESVPQLPVMEGAGELGKIASGNIKAAPVITYFAKKAVQAAEGYAFGITQGHGATGSGKDAAGFAIIGAGTNALGKFLGKMVSIVGRKGVQEQLAKTVEMMESVPTGAPLKISDPIFAAHHEGLNNIAREHFGVNGYNFLKPEQKMEAIRMYGKITGEQAQQVATNNPEVFKANIDANIKEDTKKNPVSAGVAAIFAKHGKDAAQLVTEATAEQEHTIASVIKDTNDELAHRQQILEWAAKDTREQLERQAKGIKSDYPNLRLPQDLRGSKPRYGYGDKLFELQFGDERDLALYTIAQETKNKSHNKFMDYLKRVYPDKTESELVQLGKEVRGRIKELAIKGDPSNGPLYIRSSAADRKAVGAALGEVPGAATHKSLMFEENAIRNAEKQVGGDFRFEDKAHAMLAILTHVSPPHQDILIEHLQQRYKGARKIELLKASRYMKNLLIGIKMLQDRDSSGAGFHGMKVFASHMRGSDNKLATNPTKWYMELMSEFKQEYGIDLNEAEQKTRMQKITKK